MTKIFVVGKRAGLGVGCILNDTLIRKHIEYCILNTVYILTIYKIVYLKIIFTAVEIALHYFSRDVRKRSFGFPTRSDTNPSVQLQKMARSLKFWI